MNANAQTACLCPSCPGANCPCGCQQPAAPAARETACACGPQCRCGATCRCTPSAQA